MDVLWGSRGDSYQEFRKGEGLQTSSARGGGGGEFGLVTATAAVPHVVVAV
jgi:hypothetical protein